VFSLLPVHVCDWLYEPACWNALSVN
jgi:hypothetical protein